MMTCFYWRTEGQLGRAHDLPFADHSTVPSRKARGTSMLSLLFVFFIVPKQVLSMNVAYDRG
jgi:hypothetical protein